LKDVGELIGSLIDVHGREEGRDREVGRFLKEDSLKDLRGGSAEGAVWRWCVRGCIKSEDEADGAMVRARLEVFGEAAADDSFFCAQ
jgi:hypothetical protein